MFSLPLFICISAQLVVATPQKVAAPDVMDVVSPGARPVMDPSRTFILDYNLLQENKKKVLAKDAAYLKALARLKESAAGAMAVKEYASVMQKNQIAISGDKHDYLSLGTYWWPDPTKKDGLPYIRKDGKSNPENAAITDSKNLSRLSHDVHRLALCYFFSQDEAYAKQAIKMLQVWFLDPATRMNPNLNYAQVIKGYNSGKGRGPGLVDSEKLVDVIDAIQLLKTSPHLAPTDYAGLQNWFGQYSNWLVTSPHGKELEASNNNITTLYELQVISYALFAGKTEWAKQRFAQSVIPRIETQFRANGEQPAELARTIPWAYSSKNLTAWFRLATVAQTLGIDLWNLERNGRSLKTVFAWMLNYALQPETWPYKELKGGLTVRWLLNDARTASTVWPDLRPSIRQLLQPSHDEFVGGNNSDLLSQPYYWATKGVSLN
jgi:hypothetical protein